MSFNLTHYLRKRYRRALWQSNEMISNDDYESYDYSSMSAPKLLICVNSESIFCVNVLSYYYYYYYDCYVKAEMEVTLKGLHGHQWIQNNLVVLGS